MKTEPRSRILAGERLRFRYAPELPPAVDDISLRIVPGRLLAVLGPNGSGKSTLLRLLSGALKPEAGRVRLGPVEMAHLPDRDRARRIAVVPQSEPSPFPITVEELVTMGRYPHMGKWQSPGALDRAAVRRALVRCSVEEFVDRDFATLSGGEGQRVRVARALAQEPELLLLDEPTAGLDLRYQMELYTLLRSLTSESMGVLLVTHDLNLAARFAHGILLMDGGGAVAQGPPTEVVERDLLQGVYDWPLRVVTHPGPGPDARAPQAVPLARGIPE